MRRSLKFPLVLAVVVALGLVAPATVAAGNGDGSRKEVVTFVSRAELIAKGLIVPATVAARPGPRPSASGTASTSRTGDTSAR